MKIAVASGKGGTGKTTVATSLGASLNGSTRLLVDCDVEAPNNHLFFELKQVQALDVFNLVPEVNPDLCTYCGLCAKTCKFNAITVLNQLALKQPSWMLFPNLCHACGACTIVCPQQAITERPEKIGAMTHFHIEESFDLVQGLMDIGNATATPIIRQLKKWVSQYTPEPELIIYDAPPGASCAVVETVKDADFVLLVTEPTPFGLHDLQIAAELVQDLGRPAGIIINRDGIGDNQVEQLSERTGIPIMMRIPMRKEIASALSNGIPLTTAFPEYKERFTRLYQQIQSCVTAERRCEV